MSQQLGQWTHTFGGQGGVQFEEFNDSFTFSGVRGRSGDWIDKLSFDFQHSKTGEFQTTEEFGGNGGGQFTWNLPIYTEVDSITVWAKPDQYVHGIQFHLCNGEASPLFGKPTGQRSLVRMNGKKIAGFGGRVGAYLDQLRLYLVDRK